MSSLLPFPLSRTLRISKASFKPRTFRICTHFRCYEALCRNSEGKDQEPASIGSCICSGPHEDEAGRGISQDMGAETPAQGFLAVFNQEFVLTNPCPPWIPLPWDTQESWQSQSRAMPFQALKAFLDWSPTPFMNC